MNIIAANGTVSVHLSDATRRIENQKLIDNVSLKIVSGDRIAIVGDSGSGKTVLLRMLGMLDPLEHGVVHCNDVPICGDLVPAYRQSVGYMHQKPTLLEGSVESNLQQPFRLHINTNKNFNRNRVVDWLEQLGRDEFFLEKPAANLSGGESQITSLLRLLQLDPAVLLLDEPTAALDEATSTLVENLLLNWCDENKSRAFVLVSHELAQTRRLCRTRYRMTAGQLCLEDI